MKLWIALLVGFFGLSQARAEKVAVIVSTGDQGSLEDSMSDLEKQAIRTYDGLGFRVVIVGGLTREGVEPSREAPRATLGALKNVNDLRVDFIGHGILKSATSKSGEIKISADRREVIDDTVAEVKGPVKWVADEKFYSSRAMQKGKIGYLEGAVTPKSEIDNEGLREALADFRAANPSAITTINVLNCFGGALARDLRKTPNTIAFAGSPVSEIAYDDSSYERGESGDPKILSSTNALSYYYGALADRKKPETLAEARAWANASSRSGLKDRLVDSLNSWGRSPLYESVIAWCEESPPTSGAHAGTATDRQRRLLKGIKKELEDCVSLVKPVTAPEEKREELRKSFEDCVARVSARPPSIEKSEPNPTQKLFPDAKKQLARLHSQYAKRLADPAARAAIVKRFDESLVRDVEESKKRLAEHRWRPLADYAKKRAAGAIKDDDVIRKLQTSLDRMQAACSRDPVGQSPCADFRTLNRDLGEYTLDPNVNFTACPTDKKLFDCLHRLSSAYWTAYLEMTWLPLATDRANHEPQTKRDCRAQILGEHSRVEENLRLDKDCVRRFEEAAPAAEWENLERLYSLGNRATRDTSDVIPSARESIRQ